MMLPQSGDLGISKLAEEPNKVNYERRGLAESKLGEWKT
jgi:hypothetical protein